MLEFDLSQRGKSSIYEYLYKCIRSDILQGKLKTGEKLPSKRELAKDHGIAVITVENAYAQLLAEGYIESRPRSGFYVADLVSTEPHPVISPEPAPEEKSKSKEKPYLVDFTTNYGLEATFPFSTWYKLTRRVLADRQGEFLKQPPAEGIPELRQAIAGYLFHARGLEADPDRIIVGPGTEYLHMILQQLLEPGLAVVVEDPGYKKIGRLYQRWGRACIPVPVDQNGLMVCALEEMDEKNSGKKTGKCKGSRKITKPEDVPPVGLIHTSPSHHFPTGAVMSAGRRSRLVNWAMQHQAYIIEDDYDSEFRLAGHPIAPLAQVNDKCVIYMNTFTKTLAPSIRIAYMVLPESLMQRYRETLNFYSGAISSFEQYIVEAFLREGYYERHISRMRNYYRTQRKAILRDLKQGPLAGLVDVQEEDGGLHFILQVKRPLNDKKFILFLEEKGVKLSPVTIYCYNDLLKFQHQFVVNYTAAPRETLDRAVDIIAEAIALCSE